MYFPLQRTLTKLQWAFKATEWKFLPLSSQGIFGKKGSIFATEELHANYDFASLCIIYNLSGRVVFSFCKNLRS
jgi:hypothetical protein